MLEDLKGPLVLSATLHMLVALVAMIWSLIEPDKKPEELIFELYSPPAPAQQAAEQPSEDLYKPEELDLPTLEDIEVDLPEVSVVEDLPPEPEPEPEPEPVEPEVKKMTREEFIRKTGGIPKQRLSSKPKKRETVDMSNEVRELMESLDQLREARLPESTLSQMSSQQESELAHYFSSLKAAISRSVEAHPLAANRLETKVRFQLHPNGRLSNPSVVVSSGDPAFDRKVVDAFRRIGIFGSPPGIAKTETLDLTVFQKDR